MTTNNFTETARAEAEQRYNRIVRRNKTADEWLDEGRASGFTLGAEWARTHLTAQEPTDAEVLAALNAHGVVMSPKMHPAQSLDYWGDKSAEAMRAALTAARAARRDGGTR